MFIYCDVNKKNKYKFERVYKVGDLILFCKKQFKINIKVINDNIVGLI